MVSLDIFQMDRFRLRHNFFFGFFCGIRPLGVEEALRVPADRIHVWRKCGTLCTNWRTEITVCVAVPIEALVVGWKADEVCDVEDVPSYVDRTCEADFSFKKGQDK